MRPIPLLRADCCTASDAFAEQALSLEQLAVLSDEQVRDRVTTWAGRVAAGEAQLLHYIGEFDAREAWSGTGILSCAHWLSWRLGMGEKSAYERVRIARSLRGLPLTFDEFAAGRLSFTQVRAITRVATADDEHKYVRLARKATGRQLERLVRGVRRGRKIAEREHGRRAGDPPAVVAPRVTMGYDEDGSFRLSVRCSAEDGAVILAALEATRADLDTAAAASVASAAKNSSAEESPAAKAGDGDGFLGLCRAYLRERALAYPDRARRDRAALRVQVDPLSGWVRLPDGELLPPGAASVAGLTLPKKLLLRPLRRRDRRRYDSGRARREPTQALREQLGVVDGERCRIPGCSRRRSLHAHHVQWWSRGGRTDLANLVLVCSRHHTLIHSGDGPSLKLDAMTRALTVTTSAGQVMDSSPQLPWQPAEELDPHGLVHPGTLPPEALDKLNLHYAVEVLLLQAA